jgi:integrase
MTEENRIQAHLVPAFDSRLLDGITRDELQSFLNGKAKQLSQSGLDHLRFRLRSIFTLAESEGVADRNPARSLYTPKRCKPDRPRHVLTPAQLIEMVKALDLREQVIARLAMCEGMRPGEILALQIGDCGSDAIFVRRRVYNGDLDLPKTKRSIRQVALSTGTVALLNAWMSQLKNRSAEAWLFPSENETSPLRRDNVWRRNMYPKLTDAGLEWATFLVMRRTFASLSKAIGIDAHTRSAQMGNTVDVNENEYAVSSFAEKLAAVRKLESSMDN